MNKSFLAVALAASTIMAAHTASAADGTITFTGQVVAASCPITGGDGTTENDIRVELGTVSTEAFSATAPALSKDFTLQLGDGTGAGAGCKDTSAHVAFEKANITPSGNIANEVAGATVEVELHDTSRKIDLSTEEIEFPQVGAGSARKVDLRAVLVGANQGAVSAGNINAIGEFLVRFD